MRTITKSQVDLWQGETEIHGPSVKCGGRAFGYAHGDDGGYFFTWMDTLDATLASVEEDEVDGNGGLDQNAVAKFLRGYLPTTRRGRKMWANP